MRAKGSCLLTLFISLILVLIFSCKKDDDISDYRIQYCGNFYFTIITDHWLLGQPPACDTSFYNGLIRKYEARDSENDLFFDDDSSENVSEKITIEFMANTKITSIINTKGELREKYGSHYGHSGKFSHIDTINFIIGGMGGLGGGWSYSIKGIRR